MASVDMKRIKELFFGLLDLPDQTARLAYLEKECGDDFELKQGVLDLYKGHEVPATAVQKPFLVSSDVISSNQATPDEYIGTIIAAKYKILELIGEGGMGNVYMAQQLNPIVRLVAIKLIKPGMDSKTILARFEAERQALAMMDHPNIAKVLDGGATGTGLPYFVMKLVKGIPITRFCDERKLTLRQRLELFIPVCDAIHHAHQKGIIHRDIKPSNVLVALYDDKPVPMVIDFGVAKAIGGQLTDKTAFTGFGAVVGTPEYMSPEQATFNQRDIDTRSDVYSLGVLLYELLTGTTPFTRKSLANFAVMEMLRIVREMEPPTPSLRLSTDDGLPTIAANRNVEPSKLKRLLKGELDWVIMKTLDKDRARRYDSASNLARDVQRFLGDEIVEARPPSAWYRTTKFIRKNRAPVFAGVLILLSLIGGIIGTTFGLIEADHQKVIAELARQDAEEAAKSERESREVADRQREIATQARKSAEDSAISEKLARENADLRLKQVNKANDILGQIFSNLNPNREENKGKIIQELLAEQLDIASQQVEGDGDGIGDKPTMIRLQTLLGNAQRGLGYPQKAIGLLTKALDNSSRQFGTDDPKTLSVMNSLGAAYRTGGFFEKAVQQFEEVLKKRQMVLGPEDVDTLSTMGNLAFAYRSAGKLDKAIPLAQKTLELRKKVFGSENQETLSSMQELAHFYYDNGQPQLAKPIYEEVLKKQEEKLGPEDFGTLLTLNGYGSVLQEIGDREQAIFVFQKAYQGYRKKLGADHQHTLAVENNLASSYRAAGKVELALPIYKGTFERYRAKMGADHPHTLITMTNYASACGAASQFETAIPLYLEALVLQKTKLGPTHPNTVNTMMNLGVTYFEVKKYDESIAICQDALKIQKEADRMGHVYTDTILSTIGDSSFGKKDYENAEKYYTKAIDFYRDIKKLSMNQENRLSDRLLFLARAQMAQNKFPNAEKNLRECQAIREKNDPDMWFTYESLSFLGSCLAKEKKEADAEPLLLKGFDGLKKREEKIPKNKRNRLKDAAQRLVEFYETLGNKEKATHWKAIQEKLEPPKTALPS